ncbi:hypothetical protein MHU86_15024 [Fragilaria crotonensis]|nr:hypothetical protein MHU86_15024 [Fragilaria crotonensis]
MASLGSDHPGERKPEEGKMGSKQKEGSSDDESRNERVKRRKRKKKRKHDHSSASDSADTDEEDRRIKKRRKKDKKKEKKRKRRKDKNARMTAAVTKSAFVGVLFLERKFKCTLTKQMTIWPKIKHEKNSAIYELVCVKDLMDIMDAINSL